MTRVFLTGATGNAGQPVLAELLRRGYDVTALVRRPAQLDGCRTVLGNLADLNKLAAEIGQSDAVIHLASPRSNDRDTVLRYDIRATGELLDLWQRGNFIYASSQTVYGIPRQPLTENSPLDAMCWYDLGKMCNEFQLRMSEPDERRGAAVSLRMALLFAAGDRRGDRQFLRAIYDQCRSGATFVFDSEEGLEMYGTSFIGEADFGRAVVDALGIRVSGPYNLAGPFCTWRSLIETLNRHVTKRATWVIRPGAEAGPREYRLPQSRSCLDASAFAAQTGFAPRQTLEEVIARFVAVEHGAA
jgi:nucleoside-diphosphate-sugar epimerase